MKMKQIFGVLLVLVLAFALTGCKKDAPKTTEPTAPTAPTAPTTEPSKSTTPAGSENLVNVQETSTGFCGDKICQNVEHQYPDSKVVCDQFGCTINGKYTENNFNCPGDCGTKCTEKTVIGVKPPVCKLLSNGDVQINLINSGYEAIDGFLFYIAENPSVESGKVGYSTSEKGLAKGESGVYTVDVAQWKEKFGTVSVVQVMPRVVDNGQTKECANQKVLVPITSCR